MVTAQPVQSFGPLIIFGLAILAGVVTGYIIDTMTPPPAGVDKDDHLELFYHAKDNELRSLTITLMDQCSSIDTMGYYLGRKTEYAAMSYLNDTLYPTYPKWQILNASILPELSQMWHNLIGGYTSSIQDSVRYAQETFTGELSELDLKFDSTSVKTGSNDFRLMCIQTYNVKGAFAKFNTTLGYMYVNGSQDEWAYIWQSVNDDSNLKYYFDEVITGNSTAIDQTATTWERVSLADGIYQVIREAYSSSEGTDYHTGFATDSLFVESGSGVPATIQFRMLSPSRAGTWTGRFETMNFIDSEATTYTIDLETSENTHNYCNVTRATISTVVTFANSLSNAYWTTLRNAEIYDASDIPPEMVIPLPDFGFISNEDILDLNEYEIMAMYLAYMKALGNFFNSSTYELITNTSFYYANVTFANVGVVVNGTLYRDEAKITNGSLYIQVYDDMFLTVGNNTLNSSGLIYNLNDTTCWSYAADDILEILEIWVKDPDTGLYSQVENVTIEAETIEAYLYQSDSGPPAQPAGGSAAGGGGELIILIVLILLALVLGKSQGGSGGSGPIIFTNKKQYGSYLEYQHR